MRNQGASIATAAAVLTVITLVGIFVKVNYDARLEAETARRQAEVSHQAFQASVRDSVPLLVQLARVAVEQQQWEEARRKVDTALKADPSHAEARLLKAQVLMALRTFRRAEDELRLYLSQRPLDAAARRLLPLCQNARPDELDRLLPLADELARQQEWSLVSKLLEKYGNDSTEARQVLAKAYQERIEKAWPGKGTNLTVDGQEIHLRLSNDTAITDLAPLRGMLLTRLDIGNTRVSDLSPLQGAALTWLNCYGTQVSDLTPLKGMPVTWLNIGFTKVSDLGPLKGMPLTWLYLVDTKVSDLKPLEGMPLTTLICAHTGISDLTPLAGMRLEHLRLTPKNITRGWDVIRAMPSLKTIAIGPNLDQSWPVAEFWKRYDAGEFN
ncbi:MAG: tetratricopeptide repeat protein [Gemmataceae bacterium]|nr:tetratricopeptide repeat protein [Gemmataceae bacterium]